MHTHSGEAEPPTEQNDPPFALSYVFKANVKQKYTCVATFPWDAGSIDELWKGQLTPPPETTPTTDVSTRWSSICEKYGGSFAIGSDAGDLEIWKVNLAADSRTRNAVDRLLAVSLKEVSLVWATVIRA